MRLKVFARLGVAAFLVVSVVGAEGANAMRFEGEAGLAFSKFTSNTPATLNGNTAFTFGGLLDFDLSEPFSFETGLRYVPKGFNTPGFTQSNYYLSLPLLLKLRFPSPVGTPFIALGPEISYELGNYYSVTIGALPTKSLDFGLNFGGGLEFSLLPGITNYLRVAYSLGLANIADTDLSPGLEGKTRALLVTLGIVL